MQGLAAKAFARGMNVVRLNQRNCGDTEQLSAGLFHSGLTADAAHVVDELTRVDGLPAIAVAGYSLGGNLALKLAGEYGAHAPAALVASRPSRRSSRSSECIARARAAGECSVSVELREGSEAADAPQGRGSGPGSSILTQLRRDQDRARVRRGVHGAVLRFRERRRLLPSRQRDARRRSHPRAGADHHRRGRSVRAVAAVPRSEDRGKSAHRSAHLPHTAGTAASSVPAARGRRVLGGEARLWTSWSAVRREHSAARAHARRSGPRQATVSREALRAVRVAPRGSRTCRARRRLAASTRSRDTAREPASSTCASVGPREELPQVA